MRWWGAVRQQDGQGVAAMIAWARRVQWTSVVAGVLLGVGIAWIGAGWAATKDAAPSGQEAQVLLPAKTLDDIYQKLDEIKAQAKRYGSRATQTLEKLDLVLQNQEAIKKELDVIRVRASR